MSDTCPTDCPPPQLACDNPFDRLVVSRLFRGGTRVMWELRDDFFDARPYSFQLQVGETANPTADDWKSVGLPVTEVFYAIDGEQRIYGKHKPLFYRVQLTTSSGTYTSPPVGDEAVLGARDTKIAREIIRNFLVHMRHNHGGQVGYLLKRRITGEDCTECQEFLTGEVVNPGCSSCFGTGKRCGYYFPVSCAWVEMDPKTYVGSPHEARGTVKTYSIRATMLNTQMLFEGDVWVNKRTDDRYIIHAVQNVAEVRGVALISQVEMSPVPVSDPIYSIDIPDQIDEI